jgi:hypothetical protein
MNAKKCPGKGVKRLLTDLEELDFMEEITFQQWVTILLIGVLY